MQVNSQCKIITKCSVRRPSDVCVTLNSIAVHAPIDGLLCPDTLIHPEDEIQWVRNKTQILLCTSCDSHVINMLILSNALNNDNEVLLQAA